jgi:hypothetical protein
VLALLSREGYDGSLVQKDLAGRYRLAEARVPQ